MTPPQLGPVCPGLIALKLEHCFTLDLNQSRPIKCVHREACDEKSILFDENALQIAWAGKMSSRPAPPGPGHPMDMKDLLDQTIISYISLCCTPWISAYLS